MAKEKNGIRVWKIFGFKVYDLRGEEAKKLIKSLEEKVKAGLKENQEEGEDDD